MASPVGTFAGVPLEGNTSGGFESGHTLAVRQWGRKSRRVYPQESLLTSLVSLWQLLLSQACRLGLLSLLSPARVT